MLADLEAQRTALDQAIAAIRGVMERRSGSLLTTGPAPASVTSDTFLGLSIPDAAKKYLQMAGEKRTTQQICDALVAGGFVTKAKDFPSSVQTTLRRYIDEHDDLIRIGNTKNEWGLPGWYGPRARQQQGVTPRKPKTDEPDGGAVESAPTQNGASSAPKEAHPLAG